MSQVSSSLIVSRRREIFDVSLVMGVVFWRGNISCLVVIGFFFYDFIFRIQFNGILSLTTKEPSSLTATSATAIG